MSGCREETHAMPPLPEHLVENIVARISFPNILKARLLSKEWKLKFSSETRQSFLSWPQYFSYCRESEVVGYDAVLDSVKRMPVCRGNLKSRSQFYSSGPLLVTLILNSAATSIECTVNNVLTRKCRKIFCSFERRVTWYDAILVPVGTEHYELLIWCYDVGDLEEYTTFAVYSSKSCSWTENAYITGYVPENAAYINGTLHYITGGEGEPLHFVRLDMQSGDQTETPIPLGPTVDGLEASHFTVRCGSDIMTVLTDYYDLIVSQLDTESSALVEVSRSPILEEDYFVIHRFGASRNRVYLRLEEEETSLLYMYEVDSKTWSRSHVPQELSEKSSMDQLFVLELGLNPFVEP